MLSVHTNERGQNKKENPAIKMLPGFVATIRIRCGKKNCRCTRGPRHVAHYHVTYLRGMRFRQYVPREHLPAVLAACEAHRALQAQLRAGRARYKELLAQTRQLIKLLAE